MTTNIRAALTRKFGPLPAWAWLTILAAAVYFYRSRGGGGGGGLTSTGDSDPIEPSDPTGHEPITLQPGESIYDPNTGQLIGTAPEQQPSPEIDPLGPLTPEPVEDAAPDIDVPDSMPAAAVPPPTAGKKKPGPLARAKAAVLGGKVGPINRQRLRRAGYSDAQIDYHAKRGTALATPQSKKKPKPKPQHKPPQPVKHHTPVKAKPRHGATTKKPVARPKTPVSAHKSPKPRAKPAPKASVNRPRQTTTHAPVVRQRPAPSHTKAKAPAKTKKTKRR